MVLVDVTVTDKRGNPVSGLTQKDFRVWEDNKEQVISSFSVEGSASVKAGAPRRYLVLFFDDTTIGLNDRARVREAAAELIRANSGANGLMALVNFSGGLQIIQNFHQRYGSPERGGWGGQLCIRAGRFCAGRARFHYRRLSSVLINGAI
jgi:VWFA-related protein